MIVKGPEWKTFKTLSAIDSFRTYWQENERLINNAAEAAEVYNRPKWTPKTDEENEEFDWERRVARELHDEVMMPNFQNFCVVMLYALTERELLRLIENLEKERGLQKLSYKDIKGIKGVQEFLEVVFSLRIKDCPDYVAWTDLQKIRNCIVHCNGEVNLSKDADHLNGLKNRRPGFYAIKGTVIGIESVCVEQFIREMRQFFEWVFDQLKWCIRSRS